MTREEKVRRLKDKDLFERCRKAFPKEMGLLRAEFKQASANRNKAKMLRLTDKYCLFTLKVEPKCEL